MPTFLAAAIIIAGALLACALIYGFSQMRNRSETSKRALRKERDELSAIVDDIFYAALDNRALDNHYAEWVIDVVQKHRKPEKDKE